MARSLKRAESQSLLQQDEVIAGRDTSLAIRLLRLPPSAADVGDFEDVVLLEADFVRIVGVRFVAVDGLRAVRVVEFGLLLAFCNASARR